MVMKNRNKCYSILEVILAILAIVIIGVGVYGCKKEEPIREDTLLIESIKHEPSTGNVSSEDKLYKQTKIVFSSNRDGNQEIYVMNADGSGQKNLTNYPDAGDTLPSWSPNGKKIAFVSIREGHSEICIMNADGSEMKNLTNNPTFDSYPSWSPDGKKIAFFSVRDMLGRHYIMNSDGSGLKRLIDDDYLLGWSLSWSPDGKKIAFMSSRDGDTEIYVVNVDGSDQKNLTNNPADDKYPSWSPDGTKLSFTSNRGGVRNDAIYIMNADGSQQRRLTPYVYNWMSSWSPDGTKIAFTGKGIDIYIINTDGSEQKRLTNNNAEEGFLSWSPSLLTENEINEKE